MRLRMLRRMSAAQPAVSDLLGPVEIYDETTGTVLIFNTWLDADTFGLTGEPGDATLRDAGVEDIFEVTLADLVA